MSFENSKFKTKRSSQNRKLIWSVDAKSGLPIAQDLNPSANGLRKRKALSAREARAINLTQKITLD